MSSRRVVLLAVVFAAWLLPVAAAGAGTYNVYTCWAGYDTYRNPSASGAAWVKDQAHDQDRFLAYDQCGSSNVGLGVISNTGLYAPKNSFGEIRFQAPYGLTLERVQMWRAAWTYGQGSGSQSQRNFLANYINGYDYGTSQLLNAGDVYDGSFDVPEGTVGANDLTNHGLVAGNFIDIGLSGQRPQWYAYRVGCSFDAGCQTGGGPEEGGFASTVHMFGAIVTVRDVEPPTMDVAEGGLFRDGERSGVEIVTVKSAADYSGIKRLAVYADGATAPIALVDYEKDQNRCEWSKPDPCRAETNVELPVDTRRLSDGPHNIVVRAYDAADNYRASATHKVTIRNHSSSVATPDSVGTPAGEPADTTVESLPNGVGASDDARLLVFFDRNKRDTIRARFATQVPVRGKLVDGTGHPITEAGIELTALAAYPGAPRVALGGVRTSRDGEFTLNVPTVGGSRDLRFSYRARIGGVEVAATQITLKVKAGVTLKTTPHHLHNGQIAVYSGRLLGGPIPRTGKLVDLQVRIDGGWRTFATVRSKRSGAYRYRYRFRRTFNPVTYKFRALCRYETGYPYVAGYSRIQKIHVG